jgi:hypothetical protein
MEQCSLCRDPAAKSPESTPRSTATRKRRLREFSKRVVAAMILLWFLGAIYGGIVVWRCGYGLEALFSYIGEPMSMGIVGYLLKSGFENKEKIKQSGEGHP